MKAIIKICTALLLNAVVGAIAASLLGFDDMVLQPSYR